jgi:hydroxymethylglutaryl-CoA lyase
LSAVEATSFVHPRWVPQLADADQVARALPRDGRVRYPVLVPNQAGLRRAIDAGVREVAIFGSATETFARRNLNRSIDESLEMFAPVVAAARSEGLRVRGYLSMVFGDPWEGAVAVEQVVAVTRRLWALGLDELSLGDTIGVATPLQVQRVLRAVAGEVPAGAIAVHFHDTYGQALANVLAALEVGVTTVDAAVAGLGGCPYARSATGNLATEDLVYMLDGLGVRTGVRLEALVDTAWWVARRLGREPGRVARALAAPRSAGPVVSPGASGEPA